MGSPNAPSTTSALQARALRLLAQREHSRAELRRKLAIHAPPDSPEILERVLDRLQDTGLQDEQRSADAVVRRRSSRLGAARLQSELRGSGLAPDAIAQALGNLTATERERALAVWQKKFGCVPVDARETARQLRFLLGRGFSAEVARQVVPRAGGVDTDADAPPGEAEPG